MILGSILHQSSSLVKAELFELFFFVAIVYCTLMDVLWTESGGGVALLYAGRELDNIQTANFDQKM